MWEKIKKKATNPDGTLNKAFLTSLFAALIVLIQQVCSVFGVEVPVDLNNLQDVFNSILIILVIAGVVSVSGQDSK